MNDDYLWNKSGQPDPEIQKLEEILGTLRYQPKLLELPQELSVPRRRNYLPLIAIAASLLLALLAAGIWFRVRTQNKPKPQEAQFVSPPAPVEEKQPATIKQKAVDDKPAIAVNVKHRPKFVATRLTKQQREEALIAKEQVMLALRLASEKLNLVHRRTQNTTPANQIKNQHRVG